MTDQELKDLVASLAVAQAENAAGFAALREAQTKTEAQLVKTDAKLNKVTAMYGGISDNLGAATEEFFYNSLLDKPQIGNLKFDQINMNMQGGKKNDRFECDLAAINGKSLALIEVKYNVHEDAIAQVESHLRRFRKFFPYYASHKIYGGIAGFHISKDVAALAHKKGLFVLKRKGEAFTASTVDMKAF